MDIIDIAIAKSKSTAIDPSDISSAVSDYLDEHDIGNVSDVQINGESVVTDGIADIPIATQNISGLIRLPSDGTYGITKWSNSHPMAIISAASIDTIRNPENTFGRYKPITPIHQHESTFFGLAKIAGHDENNSTLPVGQYTEGAKSAISDMLNGAIIVEGTTPTINALSGVRYVCGEIATLDFTPCASGICDVVFMSGATATVLTVPSTVKWANGFDPTSLDSNTTYEINIMDGLGVAVRWT